MIAAVLPLHNTMTRWLSEIERVDLKRTRLFNGCQPKVDPKKPRAVIFVDESGTPTTVDLNPPEHVVAAVVVESGQELVTLEQRFRNGSAIIKRPIEHELKSSGLSPAKHIAKSCESCR